MHLFAMGAVYHIRKTIPNKIFPNYNLVKFIFYADSTDVFAEDWVAISAFNPREDLALIKC